MAFRSAGMPTSMDSCFTASHAALRYSSCVMLSMPSTPIARAISRYFSPVYGALYSMMVGNRMAFATPCGVSYTAPRECAMECTMPRPTFEKPCPAMYCARAMPSRPSASPATDARRYFAIRRMASRWNMSVISHAPFVL